MNTINFKVGDMVIHKITKEKMIIKRINKNVATLKKLNPVPFMLLGIEYAGDIAICNLDNLKYE